MTRLVSHVLKEKGYEVWSVASETPVFDALRVMAEKNVGALLVMDTDQLKGVFSERDYARKVILKGKSSRDIPVREIMSSRVFVVHPGQSIEECMALMTQQRIRHLPVYSESRLVGLISIGDVVKALIEDQEFLIRQLEGYITGSTGYSL